MKSFLSILTIIILLASCKSKTEKLLIKKWDCVKVDNLDPVDTKFQTPEDSVKVAAIEAAMKSLSWTFKNDGSYTTGTAVGTVVQGTYIMDDKEKTLTCTTSSKNNSNIYTITVLTENELVLSSAANGKSIVMHFLPAQ